jgi:pimeloyl-ACP methyl ester carboxylesterase
LTRTLQLLLLATTPLVLFAVARGGIGIANQKLLLRYPPPGVMIPVDSHRIHLYCAGHGTPTVLIEPGMGNDWVSWRYVSLKLAETARVCVYDRAGYGWSDPGPKPRTAGRIAGELHALLAKAEIGGPVILVAHSFGAYVARIYANRFPESLGAVVLVDPSGENGTIASTVPMAAFAEEAGLLSLIPPLGWQQLKRLYEGDTALPADIKDLPAAYRHRAVIGSSLEQLRTERNEFDSLSLSEAEVRTAPFPQNLPLTVLTAMRGASPDHREVQRKIALLSTQGKQVLAETSGHAIQLDQPELIVNAILELNR